VLIVVVVIFLSWPRSAGRHSRRHDSAVVVGVCSLMLIMGFSFNLLTLLAMVLAMGSCRRPHRGGGEHPRHLEEGRRRTGICRRAEIVGPVIR